MNTSILMGISSFVYSLMGDKPIAKPQNKPESSKKEAPVTKAAADQPAPVKTPPIPPKPPMPTVPFNLPGALSKPVAVEKTFTMGRNLKTTAMVYELGPDCILVKDFIRVINTDHPEAKIPSINFERCLVYFQGFWQAVPDIRSDQDALEVAKAWKACCGDLQRFKGWYQQFKARKPVGNTRPAFA